MELYQYIISVDAMGYEMFRKDTIQVEQVDKVDIIGETEKSYKYDYKNHFYRRGEKNEQNWIEWQKENGYKLDETGWKEAKCSDSETCYIRKEDIDKLFISNKSGARIVFIINFNSLKEYQDEELISKVKQYLKSYFDNILNNVVLA